MWEKIKANKVISFIIIVLIICAICWIASLNGHVEVGSHGISGGVKRDAQ